MQFIGKPKPLLPFMNTKDCSLKLCSTFCPQWCDGIFLPPGPPPPPPFTFPDDKSETSPTFSPLVIAIIGILASAFLLVSYYAIITKYCGKSNSSSRRSREIRRSNNEELFEDGYDDGGNTTNNTQQQQHHEAWLINTPGLDEALINKITLVSFKKGDGLIGSSDCSVCLGEFHEDDTLRLLPKCSHAFHVACIDTWLRSHLNCPLCRANIISTYSQPPPSNHNNPHIVVDNSNNNNNNNNNNDNNNNNVIQDHSTMVENQVAANEEISSSGEGRQQLEVIVEQGNGNIPKTTPFRALSDLGVRGHGGRDTMRRSISMDHRHETRVSIPDVYVCSHGEDCIVQICRIDEQPLKITVGESSKVSVSSSSNRSAVLHCVKNSVAMKRSFSGGKFLFSKHVKGKNAVNPL